MKTQSTGIERTKRTSLLINKCSFDHDFFEDTDDDIQMENQSDIDCDDDDEDVLECIYQNDVSISFIIVEYASFFLFLFNHSDANSIS
jgi:hypothetical protein